MEKCCYSKAKTCLALCVKKCEGCAFFKTKEQQKASRAKVVQRLQALPIDAQYYILGKYYPTYKHKKPAKGAEQRELFKHIK